MIIKEQSSSEQNKVSPSVISMVYCCTVYQKKRITINLGDIIKNTIETSRKCPILVLIHRVAQIPYSFAIQATCLALKFLWWMWLVWFAKIILHASAIVMGNLVSDHQEPMMYMLNYNVNHFKYRNNNVFLLLH